MKDALTPTLPDDILHRAKRGFGTPMGAWLKKELLAVVRELLSSAVVRRRGLFDAAAVSTLVADHEANRSDGTDALLALLNLEVWSRVYLDARAPDDVADELKSLAAPRAAARAAAGVAA
jgi:asparagine synthase (glutamine-hydrolysing)